jgi:RNA polymerase sigma factor (TIGR02999 family)
MGRTPPEVTVLLSRWSNGDREALEELTPVVYGELRQVARAYMAREAPGHTLQATALVNEAYIRLCGWEEPSVKDRSHFFAVSARLMRNILVDRARTRRHAKRGGDQLRVTLSDDLAMAPKGSEPDYIGLDEALKRLEGVDPRKTQVVELSFFGGLTASEIGEVLNVSPSTVMRDLIFAKSWLRRELSGSENP